MLVDAVVHASGASKKFISPFVPALAAKRKNKIDRAENIRNTTSGKTSKDSVQAKHFSSEKGVASRRSTPIELLVLLGFPSCRLSLLLLLRRTHELANSCLLSSRSSFFFVVVNPDVLLVKQRRLLLHACGILIQRPIHTGFKLENFFLYLRFYS